MISWIQRYFQHHFKTIFAVLLGLMIISFVMTIGPSGLGRGSQFRSSERRFFGHNLNSEESSRQIAADAELSFRLNPTSYYLSEDFIENRLAALHFADEMHIPQATDAEIKAFVQNLRAFRGQDGQFNAEAYQNFRTNLKAMGHTEGDVRRILSDDVRIEKVNALVGGPGYALPGEVQLQLKSSDTTWTLGTASVDYASFAVDVKPTDAELNKFFEDYAPRYEIPPRALASYVLFPAAAYVGGVTVTDAEVRAFYDANPARFPKPVDPKTPAPLKDLKTDPAAHFPLVRGQVEAAMKMERAQKLAAKAASDFVYEIYKGNVAAGPELDAFLAKKKLEAKTLAPFTSEAPPAELGGSHEIAEAVFRLDEKKFYTDALVTPAGAVVVFRKGIEPARKPDFKDVRARVAADYIENEKQKRFIELGKKLRAQLESHLKAGEAFDKAAAAVGTGAGVKIETKNVAAFTPRTAPQDLDRQVLGVLDGLEKGQVSDMILTQDKKGVLVFVADKKAPDLSDANAQYTATRAMLANASSRIASVAILNELVELEKKRIEPKAE